MCVSLIAVSSVGPRTCNPEAYHTSSTAWVLCTQTCPAPPTCSTHPSHGVVVQFLRLDTWNLQSLVAPCLPFLPLYSVQWQLPLVWRLECDSECLFSSAVPCDSPRMFLLDSPPSMCSVVSPETRAIFQFYDLLKQVSLPFVVCKVTSMRYMLVTKCEKRSSWCSQSYPSCLTGALPSCLPPTWNNSCQIPCLCFKVLNV